ncbi:titin-like isoform X3 [Dreissena polymorpha]|nr:titin-like isoform X3 [Dreissena polymorpha]XP_052257766.1 titin-like isoform X3 [Dreissena polymorpha]XP_052257767.1 titin-like isoform X3 [Dreissena polymorpha]XP_052257768.1 titin-like isoform X3 [Dreissena polymorpha]
MSVPGDVMNWSSASYRLDELERKFTFPCVVRLAEGFCSDSESEGFSKDDIIGIDSKLVLHKVAAHFTNRKSGVRPTKGEYDFGYERLSDEILVPLNYKGKAKVQTCTGKTYTTVKDLIADFPRFAKICRTLKAYSADDQPMDLPGGSTIELDRILPGRNIKPDVLCIKFNVSGKPTYAKVAVTERAEIQCESDETEYTIKEVIDRFKLPQIVKFVDDDIRKVYTQDLVEGIENMRTITETLQLNRLVTQNVLVGHYKAVEGMETVDTDSYRKRTLVVLPLDHPEIREIEVNVLEDDGDISEIYERVFNVSNISSSLEVVDTIYVEFCKDTPSPKMFKLDTPVTAHRKPTEPEEEPPRPPPRIPGPPSGAHVPAAPEVSPKPKPKPKPNKPGAHVPSAPEVSPKPKPKPKPNKPGAPPVILPKPNPIETTSQPLGASAHKGAPKANRVEKRTVHPPVIEKDDQPPPLPFRNPQKPKTDDKSAEITRTYYNSPQPVVHESAPVNADDYEIPEDPKHAPNVSKGQPAHVVSPPGFDLASMYSSSSDAYTFKEGKEKAHKGIFKFLKKRETSPVKPMIANKTPDNRQDHDDDCVLYDEVKEEDMLDEKTGLKKGAAKVAANTAIVKPMTSKGSMAQSSQSKLKPFIELNCSELVERLNLCKMHALAKECEEGRLDGGFFKSLTSSDLESALHLQKLDVLKLLQMRDKNWIPND